MDINLKIDKSIAGKTLDFKTFEELSRWISEERSSFNWLSNIGKNLSTHLHRHIDRYFHEAITITNKHPSFREDDSSRKALTSQLIEWFKSAYATRNLILSSSSEIKFVNSLRGQSPEAAAHALAHILNYSNAVNWGFESPAGFFGAASAFQFKNGLSKHALNAEIASLNDLKNDWDKILEECKGEFREINEAHSNAQNSFIEFIRAASESFAKFEIDSKETISSIVSQSHTDLGKIKNTYDQYMALSAPVSYWTSKKTFHSKKIPYFRNWTILIGVLGGSALIAGSIALLLNDIDKVPYWKLTILLLSGTLLFWLLRVMTKLLLSHIHLESDAHEREVMAQTYLALLKEKSGLKEDDKKLILTTLFRPTSSGIINDDGAPPGVYDALTRIVQK